MLEQLMHSKIRTKVIQYFLENKEQRFYLRQLERLLQLPLTPLRRELRHLTQLGLLKEEPEANLKFYHLNTAFDKLEELTKLMGVQTTGAENLNTSVVSPTLPYISPSLRGPKGRSNLDFKTRLLHFVRNDSVVKRFMRHYDKWGISRIAIKEKLAPVVGFLLFVLLVIQAVFFFASAHHINRPLGSWNVKTLQDEQLIMIEGTIQRMNIQSDKEGKNSIVMSSKNGARLTSGEAGGWQ